MSDTIYGRLHSPLLKRLYGYWILKRDGRPAPSRADLEPRDLAALKLLPNVMLLDVEPEPLRFRFRLAGTEVARRFKREPTGRFLDEIEFQDRPGDWARAHILASRSGRAQTGASLLIGPGDDMIEFEWLVLPLSSNGTRIDRLLAGAAFASLTALPEPAIGSFGQLAYA